MTKSDLDEKTAQMSDLTNKVEEMRTHHGYQMRLKDKDLKDKITGLTDKFTAELEGTYGCVDTYKYIHCISIHICIHVFVKDKDLKDRITGLTDIRQSWRVHVYTCTNMYMYTNIHLCIHI